MSNCHIIYYSCIFNKQAKLSFSESKKITFLSIINKANSNKILFKNILLKLRYSLVF